MPFTNKEYKLLKLEDFTSRSEHPVTEQNLNFHKPKFIDSKNIYRTETKRKMNLTKIKIFGQL